MEEPVCLLSFTVALLQVCCIELISHFSLSDPFRCKVELARSESGFEASPILWRSIGRTMGACSGASGSSEKKRAREARVCTRISLKAWMDHATDRGGQLGGKRISPSSRSSGDECFGKIGSRELIPWSTAAVSSGKSSAVSCTR